MLRFVIHRIFQAVLTILGVMILTFLLFRLVAGDVAAMHAGQKATEQAKADWRHKHGYDKPSWTLVNIHRRLKLVDATRGPYPFKVVDPEGSLLADNLTLVLEPLDGLPEGLDWYQGDPNGASEQSAGQTGNKVQSLLGRYAIWLERDDPDHVDRARD